jgi:hypothetical protein
MEKMNKKFGLEVERYSDVNKEYECVKKYHNQVGMSNLNKNIGNKSMSRGNMNSEL